MNLEISLPPRVAEKVHCCKLLAETWTSRTNHTNHLRLLGVDSALNMEGFSYFSIKLHPCITQ